MLEKLDFVGNY